MIKFLNSTDSFSVNTMDFSPITFTFTSRLVSFIAKLFSKVSINPLSGRFKRTPGIFLDGGKSKNVTYVTFFIGTLICEKRLKKK